MTISLYLVSFSDKLTWHIHIFFVFCATLGIRKIHFYYGRSLCICMHTVAVTRYLLDYDYQQKVLNYLSCLSFVQMCYQIIMMILKECYFVNCGISLINPYTTITCLYLLRSDIHVITVNGPILSNIHTLCDAI